MKSGLLAFSLSALATLSLAPLAQGETLTLRPGAEGKDASLFSRSDAAAKNHGSAVHFQAGTWTWDADGLGQGTHRGLIQFGLQAVPAKAKVKSAKLFLYCDTLNYTKGHSSHSVSNAAQLLRVKAAWAETTVTWANQPVVDTVGRVLLAQSSKAKQDYEADVTELVAAMVADSAANFGFQLRSMIESPYNNLIFGSSDNADSTLHPKLVVEYEVPKTWSGLTLTLDPGAEGKDALLFSRTDAVAKNYGHAAQFQAGTWSWNADGLGEGTHRSLIEFDLKDIPANAKVHSARLLLACDTVNFNKGHSSLTKSNAAWLMRVKDAWAETTVTWANQPAVDTAGRITLDQSKKAYQDYEVDVTAMVAAMVADSSKNHGFLLRSITEATYNYMAFGSSDHKDSSRHPKLVVEYELAQEWKGPKASLRPGAEGKDATVFSRKDAVAKNYGDAPQFQAGTWTWNADGLGEGTFRSLIEFDMKSIPAGAEIKNAKLFLYCNTAGHTKGHSSLSKSNAAWLMRVKDAWVESTVTWANQPAADTVGPITLAQSKGARQDYVVDVTKAVAEMAADASKNRGFLLRSIDEAPYNSLDFGSSDNADSTLRPMLLVEYLNPTTGARREAIASRSRGPRFRVAGGALLFSRPEAVEILALNGVRVAASGPAASVSLAGIRGGTYILKAASGAAMFIVP